MNEFLLNDGTINSYGFVVLTEGINLSRFIKNPVMFYNHRKDKGVIGRWENLRIENGKLYGTPVFDDKHEPGKTIKEKVESGFLKGASMGIDVLAMEDINGVKTAVKCELVEVSVCDIPSNENALQLYFNDKPVSDWPTYMQLALNEGTSRTILKPVMEVLGVACTSTIQDVVSAISRLKDEKLGVPETNTLLQSAYAEGYITETDLNFYKSAFQGKADELVVFLKNKKAEYETKLSKEYEEVSLILRNKVRGFSLDIINGRLKELAMKDMETFKELVRKMPTPLKPSSVLGLDGKRSVQTGQKQKEDWTLEDYRKNAPQELAQNPNLFKELLEKEEYKY